MVPFLIMGGRQLAIRVPRYKIQGTRYKVQGTGYGGQAEGSVNH